MKRAIYFVMAMLAASAANAGCIGGSSFQTCSDSSGNNYTVSRFGNTTIMNGSNYQTGSTWSQQSTTFGRTTIHNGIDKDGDSWSTSCFNGICN